MTFILESRSKEECEEIFDTKQREERERVYSEISEVFSDKTTRGVFLAGSVKGGGLKEVKTISRNFERVGLWHPINNGERDSRYIKTKRDVNLKNRGGGIVTGLKREARKQLNIELGKGYGCECSEAIVRIYEEFGEINVIVFDGCYRLGRLARDELKLIGESYHKTMSRKSIFAYVTCAGSRGQIGYLTAKEYERAKFLRESPAYYAIENYLLRHIQTQKISIRMLSNFTYKSSKTPMSVAVVEINFEKVK